MSTANETQTSANGTTATHAAPALEHKPPPPHPSVSLSEADLRALAEKVYKLMRHELLTERERLGRFRL